MAVQPPLPPAPQGAAIAPPAQKKSGCAGCSVGCLGCIGAVVLVVALLLGGGYFFLIAQAGGGVPSPAALQVFSDSVEVGHNDGGYAPATSGQSLDAGTSVRTGHTGHAAIRFPDGTLTRLSPDTTVTIQAAQLSSSGNLKSVTLIQKIGRTLSTVQHLAGGASFHVGGHSVTAEVRGTQFEVWVRENLSNLIKVLEGIVTVVGQTTTTLTAGQQVDVDPNGKLAGSGPIQRDPQDPYPLATQCQAAVSGGGNSAGTAQTTTNDSIATGATAEVDYRSPGGTVTVALCYPGSQMTLTVIDPNGASHPGRGGSPPVTASVAGPAGLYRAIVHAVSSNGEAYSVSFATNAACTSGDVDAGGSVRHAISNAQLTHSLSDAGISGVTLEIQGASSTSARVYYHSTFGGNEITWTIDVYAATPNIGWVITSVTFRGIDVTTKVVDKLTSSDKSISTIPTDFIIDRVYSCEGPDGNLMVIEGHH